MESEMLMTEAELLEHHSKFNGGDGKEVLTWKNTSNGANDREMKEKQNHCVVFSCSERLLSFGGKFINWTASGTTTEPWIYRHLQD